MLAAKYFSHIDLNKAKHTLGQMAFLRFLRETVLAFSDSPKVHTGSRGTRL